jgi:hypothetical protein
MEIQIQNIKEKEKTDYTKSIIYKIVSKDISVSFTYIGSTSNFSNRKSLHKSDYYNVKSPRHRLQIYEFIRNNGDWNNFVIVLIEEYNCKTKRELEMQEQYWKDIYEDNIGLKKAYITKEQIKENKLKHYLQNKEQILEKQREQYANDKSKKQQYYQEHKEQILSTRKEYYKNKKALDKS